MAKRIHDLLRRKGLHLRVCVCRYVGSFVRDYGQVATTATAAATITTRSLCEQSPHQNKLVNDIFVKLVRGLVYGHGVKCINRPRVGSKMRRTKGQRQTTAGFLHSLLLFCRHNTSHRQHHLIPRQTLRSDNKHSTKAHIMPPTARSTHPDFRDHVTAAQARALDKKTEGLLFKQMDAERAGHLDRYLQIAQEMLQARLSVYKPESMPIGSAW